MVILQKKNSNYSKKPFGAHWYPIFIGLQKLKFSEMYLFQVGKYSKEFFLMTNQFHSYNTRNSNTFYLFLARTNTRLFGIKFCGAKFFNSIHTKCCYYLSFWIQIENISPELTHHLQIIPFLWKVWTQESFQREVEFDRPGERSLE